MEDNLVLSFDFLDVFDGFGWVWTWFLWFLYDNLLSRLESHAHLVSICQSGIYRKAVEHYLEVVCHVS